MSHKLRFVFDTNTLISALLFTESKPRQVFQLALQSGDVLLSQATIKELSDVLSRKKFDRYVLKEEREEFLTALIAQVVLIEPSEKVSICRDPKDNQFLELAISGKADFIVSGDDDLLELNPFREVRILNPADFLQVLQNESQSEI
jgi:putative PIN family toxin of toxin-antitoxin system